MLFLLFYHCLVEPPCIREQDQPVHCGQDHRVQLSPERQQGDYDDYDDDDDDDNEDDDDDNDYNDDDDYCEESSWCHQRTERS